MSCPSNLDVLSCGLENRRTERWEKYRMAKPVNSYQCECYDNFGVGCISWCTNLRIMNFEIIKVYGTGEFSATCTPGKKVLGCHIEPNRNNPSDNWRYYVPSSDGSKCICKDNGGATCIASCASYISNYEVASAWGTGDVTVRCNRDQYYKTKLPELKELTIIVKYISAEISAI